jgi:hypothetical protein
MSLDNKYDSVFLKQVTAIGRNREQKDKEKKRHNKRGEAAVEEILGKMRCLAYRSIPPPF